MKKTETQPIYLSQYKVPDYLVDKVNLEFELDESVTIVKSECDIYLNPISLNKSQELVLVGEALTLISVSLNGVLLKSEQFAKTDKTLTIFNVPTHFKLKIETQIKPQENTELIGLYKSSGNFCTQCEAHGFRRITYYLDRPDVMARFTTTIIADKKRYPILLSNGNLISSKDRPDGKQMVTWDDPFKKPCYLFALVAGDFDHIEDFFVTSAGKRITLRLYVEKGNQDKCHHAMQALQKAMRWDEKTYGREYDLDMYMIVAVSDFNMGAMENKGLNIFNTQYVLANPNTATDSDYIHVESVIAHEYFHNWTGNRITCRDWFQLSLKEGLTVFREQSFTQDMTSKIVERIKMVNDLRNSQFIEDDGPLAHPVRPQSYVEINNFYTSTIYNKGAEIIRMQQTILGEKRFREGMDLYFSRHDGQAVTIEEFVKAMEDASLEDLQQFRLWYSQAGTPRLTVKDQYDAEKEIYSLHIKQTCPKTPGQPIKYPLHIPISMGLLDSEGRELISQLLHLKKQEEVFEFTHIPTKPVPSLLRNFSAPVRVNYDYSTESLELLFKHDTDLFNRWEAGLRYSLNLILSLIKDYREKKSLKVPDAYIATFQYVLEFSLDDKLLASEMLSLPGEKYIGEQMAVVDVEAIHHVREFLLLEIAQALKNPFMQLYKQNTDLKNPYQFTLDAIGKRRLSNLCLFYLAQLPDKFIFDEFVMGQYTMAISHNMTDTMAALHCIANTDFPEKQKALGEFYQKWKNDALVIDKWFVLQATSKLPDTLANVKSLKKHLAFDIKNPNKVHSLIGAFSQGNPVRFHAEDGSGYDFLTDCVLELDGLNPQVAARLVKPLCDWKRYGEKRGRIMRDCLKKMSDAKPLSNDVRELVTKSLKVEEYS